METSCWFSRGSLGARGWAHVGLEPWKIRWILSLDAFLQGCNWGLSFQDLRPGFQDFGLGFCYLGSEFEP